MKEKKRKLRILNPAELSSLVGGVNSAVCKKHGDTILCMPSVADLKLCISFEATCPSGFDSKCSLLSKITIACPSKFTIKK